MSSVLTTRPDTVIAETIGDETMLIDTLSGAFYTLRGVASPIWRLFENGVSRDELVDIVQTRYPGEESAEAIDEMIGALREHEIIVETGTVPSTDSLSSVSDVALWPTVYLSPMVDRHADMTDLLLVDPLHDVDDSGWPHRAT